MLMTTATLPDGQTFRLYRPSETNSTYRVACDDLLVGTYEDLMDAWDDFGGFVLGGTLSGVAKH